MIRDVRLYPTGVADVKTGKSSLLRVKPLLKSLGYHLEVKEHNLFCTHSGVE